jgi:hypothetical protein
MVTRIIVRHQKIELQLSKHVVLKTITEAILDGKQDPELSLEKCVYEIPFEWALQRVALAGRVHIG